MYGRINNKIQKIIFSILQKHPLTIEKHSKKIYNKTEKNKRKTENKYKE